jgi:hypothetical protein
MVLPSDQKESAHGVEKEFSWPTIKIGILVVNVGIQSLEKEHNKKPLNILIEFFICDIIKGLILFF